LPLESNGNIIIVIYQDVYTAYFISLSGYIAEFDILETHRRYFLASLNRVFKAQVPSQVKEVLSHMPQSDHNMILDLFRGSFMHGFKSAMWFLTIFSALISVLYLIRLSMSRSKE